jgi:signal transduction histidine kinase/CheY-like chemotaxis protein
LELQEKPDLSHFLPQVNLERRLLFLEGAKRSPIPAILMVCFLAFNLAPSVGNVAAALWSGSVCLMFVIRLVAVGWVLKRKGDFANRSVVSLLMCGTGLLIGAAALIAILAWFPVLGEAQRSLITMMYVGWIAGGMAAQGCYPAWTPYWTVPILSGCVIAWLWHGGSLGLGVAFLLIIVFVLMTAGLMSSAKSIKESILAKFENRELARELLAQKTLVENAARAKTSFLIAASHDLRQPAMGLGLLISAIQDAPDLNAARKVAEGAERALGAMERILQALLEFSRLDTGQVKVSKAPFNLRDMLQSLIDETRSGAQPGVTLRLDSENISIVSDPSLLEQIVRNLLSNASRFTEHGSITLKASMAGHQLVIAVSDTGIGIADEAQESIFKEYFQIGKTSGSRSKGLGLGLSIVDKAAQLLGAKVSVESRVKEGSTFTVVLPVELESNPAVERAPPPIDAVPAKLRLSNKTVLIVDDDPMVRESFQTVLETFGAKVLLCANPDITFQVLKDVEGTVDAAFVDYQISDAYNGIDLIEAMRMQWPKIRCVMITGDVRKEVNERAKEALIQVLHKPLRVQRIIEVLEARV